ncbi:hypothetical protein FACS1894152_0410 [Bacilli bacterium]|nr:hypothetical protein FACS1894152_0390 [Bacilli bacterium]GHU26235.1 hypothetical protein FACS1894152_0410 [Bacilli bacterium]
MEEELLYGPWNGTARSGGRSGSSPAPAPLPYSSSSNDKPKPGGGIKDDEDETCVTAGVVCNALDFGLVAGADAAADGTGGVDDENDSDEDSVNNGDEETLDAGRSGNPCGARECVGLEDNEDIVPAPAPIPYPSSLFSSIGNEDEDDVGKTKEDGTVEELLVVVLTSVPIGDGVCGTNEGADDDNGCA